MASKSKLAQAQIASLTRQNLTLIQDLVKVQTVAETRAAATPAPAAPPSPPAAPHDDEYRRLQRESPYAAAQYILNFSGAILAERAAKR